MNHLNRPSGRTPIQLYRHALARVAEGAGASFAAVFLQDHHDARLLRPACTRSWPQSTARFLGDMRIRIGLGPTGTCVQTGRAIEVPDVFARADHQDWWAPARELGFAAVAAEPFYRDGRVGALSLYFTDRTRLGPEQRSLLRSVARQLSSADPDRLAVHGDA